MVDGVSHKNKYWYFKIIINQSSMQLFVHTEHFKMIKLTRHFRTQIKVLRDVHSGTQINNS